MSFMSPFFQISVHTWFFFKCSHNHLARISSKFQKLSYYYLINLLVGVDLASLENVLAIIKVGLGYCCLSLMVYLVLWCYTWIWVNFPPCSTCWAKSSMRCPLSGLHFFPPPLCLFFHTVLLPASFVVELLLSVLFSYLVVSWILFIIEVRCFETIKCDL